MNLLQKIRGLFLPDTSSDVEQGNKRAVGGKQRGIEFIGGLMTVRSMDFFGPYAVSPSGQWALGWRDADPAAGRGGHRSKGHGSYILYDIVRDKVAVAGKLERPNQGAVANDGSFVLHDWHFGDGLQGTFFAFAPDGRVIHQHRFEANLHNGALSADGDWAVCQTNNSDHADGNRFTAFALRRGIELFSVTPHTGWADGYEFSADGSRFTVVHNDLGKFAYDSSGSFLDEEIYETACLASKRFDIALFAAEALLKKYPADVDQARRALSTILMARQAGANDEPGWKAMALKLQGTALEMVGRLDEALIVYDEVLSMNPKIGVKRRADSLRKRLGHS